MPSDTPSAAVTAPSHLMRAPPLPHHRVPAGIALATLALLVFAALAADLHWHGPFTRADPGISIWLHARTHPWLVRAMVFISDLNSTRGVTAMALAAAVWLAWRRMFAWLLLLVMAVPGGLLLNVAVKHTFMRARPLFDGLPVSDIASYSFPSGHTAGATVWWGVALIFWLAAQPSPERRLAGAAVAALLVLLTAFSRVYLGFHYASDVGAAIAEGVAWLALCATLVPRLVHVPLRDERSLA